MSNILEINNLRKEYSNFILKDISFELKEGYIMGFIGPNGAGKSTTIKLIMNLIKRDRGKIKLFGKDNRKFDTEIKEKIGFVYDQNFFYEELTLKQMKSVISPYYKTWNNHVFHNYMKRFNLDSNKKIKELSKGMQMKYSLAIALSHNSDLIIMDEPTSGLDPIFRSELLDILSEIIQNEKKSIFFSTHITTDLEKIADYITFINNGEIIFSKTKDEILQDYRIVKGSNKLLHTELKSKFINIKKNKFGFTALTNNIKTLKSSYENDLIFEKPTIDDIMLYTIRRNKNA